MFWSVDLPEVSAMSDEVDRSIVVGDNSVQVAPSQPSATVASPVAFMCANRFSMWAPSRSQIPRRWAL